MRIFPVLLAVTLPLVASYARADDPAAARAQLEAGYALKEQGKYAEALPHLLESLRLGVELKTLTNLADCEEHLDRLVDAQKHWVMARDRAAAEGNDKLREAAASKLAALEARMPRLTLKVAPVTPAPASIEVSRDGTTLGPISLGLPLPTDPGEHVLVVRAKGHADATTQVTLAEGEQKELTLSVGPEVATPPEAPFVGPGSAQNAHHGLGTQRTAALAVMGAGGVGLVLGTIFGVEAITAWGNAETDCGTGCASNSPAQTEKSHASTDATVSTATFVVGGALLVGGIALWFTAPSSKEATSPSPAPASAPVVSIVPGLGGVSIRGAF
jgi:hypothetical protein